MITTTCMPRCFPCQWLLFLVYLWVWRLVFSFHCQLHFITPQWRKLTSSVSPFEPSIPSSSSESPATLFSCVAGSRRLVAFLSGRRLMISFSSELSTKSSSLLLNKLDNGTISSYTSSSHPNAYFNTRFLSILRIFSFRSAQFLAQVSPIRT